MIAVAAHGHSSRQHPPPPDQPPQPTTTATKRPQPNTGSAPLTPVERRTAQPNQERPLRRPHKALESKTYMIHSCFAPDPPC